MAAVAKALAETARAALRKKNFIDGTWIVAESLFDVNDPTTGAVLGQAGAASEAQGDAAVEAAAAAWKKWRKLPPAEHAGWLRETGPRRVRAATSMRHHRRRRSQASWRTSSSRARPTSPRT